MDPEIKKRLEALEFFQQQHQQASVEQYKELDKRIVVLEKYVGTQKAADQAANAFKK